MTKLIDMKEIDQLDVKIIWSKIYYRVSILGLYVENQVSLLRRDEGEDVLFIRTLTRVPKNSKYISLYQGYVKERMQDLFEEVDDIFVFVREFSLKVSTFQDISKDVEELLNMKL